MQRWSALEARILERVASVGFIALNGFASREMKCSVLQLTLAAGELFRDGKLIIERTNHGVRAVRVPEAA